MRPRILVGAILVGVGMAALLLLPRGDEPGPGFHPGGGLEAGSEDPVRALERGEMPGIPTPWNRIRVEVLNAGGVQGMAARATDQLRRAGFDVVYFGNHVTFDRSETVVLDRTGNPGAADAVARALGVAEREEALDPGPLVDVTVLLGSSWEPGPAPDEPGGDGDGWSLRPLLDRLGVPW